MKVHYSETEIQFLLEQFEARKLAKEEWTHSAHLIVAVCYCQKHPFDEALRLIKANIKTFNESAGILNTEQSGYHETLTRFWLLNTYNYLHRHKHKPIAHCCSKFMVAKIGQSDYPLEFYSKERLFSVEARKRWVDPDLKELDYF